MNMENGCHASQIPRASPSAVPSALRATLPLLSLALGGVLCVVLLAPLTLAPLGTAAEGEGQGGAGVWDFTASSLPARLPRTYFFPPRTRVTAPVRWPFPGSPGSLLVVVATSPLPLQAWECESPTGASPAPVP